jgi:XRE family transcriptional regulator, regulator of sulfur utilization
MDLLRRLRQAKGWSQDHLAAAAVVSKATIQRIEAGQSVPSLSTAQSLGAALSVDADEIRKHAGFQFRLSKVMDVLLQRDPSEHELELLPARVRKVLVTFCDARTALTNSQQKLSCASQRVTAAFKSVLETVGAFDKRFIAAAGYPPTRETLEDLEALQRFADAAQAEHTASTVAFREASEELDRANEAFVEAGLGITRLLLGSV